MWDLSTIIEQNNKIAVQTMMRGYKVDSADNAPPEPWTLDRVAAKLRIGPPLLSSLMDCCTNFKSIEQFVVLIRRFLPEHMEEILSQRRDEKVGRFCNLFAKKYFPLNGGAAEMSVEELSYRLPITLAGMSYSEYHELDMRPGYLLLLSLVVYPYEGCEMDMEDDRVPFNPFEPQDKKTKWRPKASDIAWVKDLFARLAIGGQWVAPMGFTINKIDGRTIEIRQADNTPEVIETVRRTTMIAEESGIKVKVKIGRTAEEKQGKTPAQVVSGPRVPLLDKVQRLVGSELAGKIPRNGWAPDWLRKATDGTRFDGVGQFADWACSHTGCALLDFSYADCPYKDGASEPDFVWSKGNVDQLSYEWPKVKEIRERIDRIVFWLEADPQQRFTELVELLCSQEQPAKPAAWDYEGEEHFIPLETDEDQEEDEDTN